MRAIVCPMCGASEFRYEHGHYECCYCNTKYAFDGKESFTAYNDEEKLTVVSVRFSRSYKTYDYLYDLEECVHRGDRLVVNGFNGETEVTVSDVRQCYVYDLPMPLEAYKYILRKCQLVY